MEKGGREGWLEEKGGGKEEVYLSTDHHSLELGDGLGL